MKVEVNEIDIQTARIYPYIGKHHDGTFVLFTKKNTGFNLRKCEWSIGRFSDTWHEDGFKYFNGEITLSND